jgi:hypothetical protein
VSDEPTPDVVSERVRLARTVVEALRRMPGVALTAGEAGRWVTADRPAAVRGVLAVAAPGGGYDLELHVVVGWPPAPLSKLGDEIRRRAYLAVKRAGLEAVLGSIEVHIDAIQEPQALAPSEVTG